jgi:hypothetical protein
MFYYLRRLTRGHCLIYLQFYLWASVFGDLFTNEKRLVDKNQRGLDGLIGGFLSGWLNVVKIFCLLIVLFYMLHKNCGKIPIFV